jgi:hypothetical protein
MPRPRAREHRSQPSGPPTRSAACSSSTVALTSGLPAELGRLAAGLRAQPFGRDALPEPVAARFVGTQGRELVEIVPAEDVSDNAAGAPFHHGGAGCRREGDGSARRYQEASSTVVRAFALAMLYAFDMVTAIIWAVLRDLRRRCS